MLRKIATKGSWWRTKRRDKVHAGSLTTKSYDHNGECSGTNPEFEVSSCHEQASVRYKISVVH